MLFAEAYARSLLILHALLGAATVAVTTHLVVWTWRWPRGDYRRVAGVRWFAAVGLGLYLAQFLLGNVIYPTYKVRVRAEYFDLNSAVKDEGALRQRARELVDERHAADAIHDGRTPGLSGPRVPAPPNLTPVSRTFDVKEHWAALGLPLALGACAMAFGWRPKQDPPVGGSLLFLFAVGAATCAWIAGLVGLWVASFRAVGGVG